MREIKTQVVILGSGPGGYSAAFRAADLGKQVVLIEQHENIGGVCLNVGCIPSKALLHVAKVLDEAKQLSVHGVDFGAPKIDINKIREWKNSIVKRLTMGLKSLARQRKVEIVTGVGKFVTANQIEVTAASENILINFEQAIIAVGSSPVKLPFLPEDSRIMNSTKALELAEIPNEMLVIGGGIIGLEMAAVYHALGSKITVVELCDQLIPGIDKDVIKPLYNYVAKKYAIMLETNVSNVDFGRFDKILVAVGRKPNGKNINAENIGVKIDDKGFVVVDKCLRSSVPHIFAVGDVAGNPMLAHKAVPEGRFVAEFIANVAHDFVPKCMPSVAYTDPEIAVVGLSETEALAKNISYGKGVFPWLASGRSLSIGRQEGMTKLLFDPVTKKVLGGAIVGPGAGELIAEVALAIEMGATAENIAHTVHPHPTLSETVMMSAEVFLGTVTDLYLPKNSSS